jgi:hypothetical protein
MQNQSAATELGESGRVGQSHKDCLIFVRDEHITTAILSADFITINFPSTSNLSAKTMNKIIRNLSFATLCGGYLLFASSGHAHVQAGGPWIQNRILFICFNFIFHNYVFQSER